MWGERGQDSGWTGRTVLDNKAGADQSGKLVSLNNSALNSRREKDIQRRTGLDDQRA